MTVTAQLLADLAQTDVSALMESIVEPINAFASAFNVTTPLRLAPFLAQTCHESAGFTRVRETLYYTHAERIAEVFPHLAQRASSLTRNPEALANAVYAGRLGNGNEASGDGYRFIGRGLIQITGRANYERYGTLTNLDLLNRPELAEQPDGAVRTALAYWADTGCNALADHDDVEGVTRAINGNAMEGLEQRRDLTERAARLLGATQ